MKWLVGLCVLLGAFSAQAQTSVHPKVQEALDWQLPQNPCAKPALLATAANVSNGDDYAQSDTDSYTIKRYERKQRRWEKCLKKYKAGLMEDFSALKDSAQYGLTKPQAEAILANMGLIQSVYMDVDGRPPKNQVAGTDSDAGATAQSNN